MPAEPALVILAMGAVTYATRAGGLLVMRSLSSSPRIEAGLEHVPGAVLISIIAPALVAAGPVGVIAGVATLLVAIKTKSLLLPMLVGIAVILTLRRLL